MKAQYVMDSEGRKTAVLLPIKEYQKILQILEDYEDIKACQESRQRTKSGQSELVSFDEVLKILFNMYQIYFEKTAEKKLLSLPLK